MIWPRTKNGILLPNLVSILSLRLPKIGSQMASVVYPTITAKPE
jgi:hypothetical protein